MVRQVESRYSREYLLSFDVGQTYDPEYADNLSRRLQARYAYEADIDLHTKMAVSELKKQGQMTDEEESVRMERMQEPIRMEQRQVSAAEGGAERGTAYHRVLELLDFHKIHSLDDVIFALSNLRSKRRISENVFLSVEAEEIWKFLRSNLGKRMSQAQKEGRLHKEQQFVMGIPAREMGVADSEELVIVQGIIDAYLEEDGQLVLIDYKTDRVWNPKVLADHYREQLNYYERALSQMTGKKVREKLIYSLTMQREIYI